MATTQAQATTNGEEQVVQASASIPPQISIAAMIVGLLLTIIGVVAPSTKVVVEPSSTYEETRVVDENGTRKKVTKKRVRT